MKRVFVCVQAGQCNSLRARVSLTESLNGVTTITAATATAECMTAGAAEEAKTVPESKDRPNKGNKRAQNVDRTSPNHIKI